MLRSRLGDMNPSVWPHRAWSLVQLSSQPRAMLRHPSEKGLSQIPRRNMWSFVSGHSPDLYQMRWYAGKECAYLAQETIQRSLLDSRHAYTTRCMFSDRLLDQRSKDCRSCECWSGKIRTADSQALHSVPALDSDDDRIRSDWICLSSDTAYNVQNDVPGR